MSVLLNFMFRGDSWSVHCLAPDCKTLVSGWSTVRGDETFLRLLKASGVSPVLMDEIQNDMARMGRGSTFVQLNETGRRLLRIK